MPSSGEAWHWPNVVWPLDAAGQGGHWPNVIWPIGKSGQGRHWPNMVWHLEQCEPGWIRHLKPLITTHYCILSYFTIQWHHVSFYFTCLKLCHVSMWYSMPQHAEWSLAFTLCLSSQPVDLMFVKQISSLPWNLLLSGTIHSKGEGVQGIKRICIVFTNLKGRYVFHPPASDLYFYTDIGIIW